jgi:hypothetical protein
MWGSFTQSTNISYMVGIDLSNPTAAGNKRDAIPVFMNIHNKERGRYIQVQ